MVIAGKLVVFPMNWIDNFVPCGYSRNLEMQLKDWYATKSRQLDVIRNETVYLRIVDTLVLVVLILDTNFLIVDFWYLFPKLLWPTDRKFVLVIEKNFWRPRVCKIFEITKTIHSVSESSERVLVQWKFRTIGNRMLF